MGCAGEFDPCSQLITETACKTSRWKKYCGWVGESQSGKCVGPERNSRNVANGNDGNLITRGPTPNPTQLPTPKLAPTDGDEDDDDYVHKQKQMIASTSKIMEHGRADSGY